MGGVLLLVGVGQDLLFKKAKREAKKSATKEDPSFAGCGADLQPGK